MTIDLKISGTTCSVYEQNHRLPAMYTVVMACYSTTAIYHSTVVSMDTSCLTS